ncbi:MAG: hypothetical protein JNK15_21515 [Planctomycetes bacterium]|nr:hypothetical protein [Planctomycetota bacterium]
MPLHSLAEARAFVVAAGVNLFGVVDCARFDAAETRERRLGACSPRSGTALVLATGGRAFARQWRRWPGGPAHTASTVAAYVTSVAEDLGRALHEGGVHNRVLTFAGGVRVHSGRLGEAAGFGVVSPVSGLLLHPEFGPWVRIRAAVLCDGKPFGEVADVPQAEGFQPCCRCAKPCVSACPVSVHDGLGNHDLHRCGSHRAVGGCDTGCASRAACPLGSEHRDLDGEDVHRHTYELVSLQRWLGHGVWRVVPPAWRGGPLPS